MFGEKCEGSFIQPTFITDYPIEMSPLTKRHRDKPGAHRALRAYGQRQRARPMLTPSLNDPIDQYERFLDQMHLAEKGDDEAMIIDP